jgi:HEAT repeat protein
MPTTTKAKIQELLEDEEFHGLHELVELPEAKTVPVLTELMSASRDPLIRQRCAIALGMIGSPKAGAALTKRLDDKSVPVVLSAVTALANLKAVDSAPRITALLKNKDPSVRRAAAGALGVLAAPDSEAALTALTTSDPMDFVREAGVEALRAIGRRKPR